MSTTQIFRKNDTKRIKATIDRLLDGDTFRYNPRLSPHDPAYRQPIAGRYNRVESGKG